MAEGKLVLLRPHDGTGRLILGDDTAVSIPNTQVVVDATFGDEMSTTVQVLWDANVSRGEAPQTRVHWQSAEAMRGHAESRWQNAQGILTSTGVRWQPAERAANRTALHWQSSERYSARTGLRWQRGTALRHSASSRWQEAERLRAGLGMAWQVANPVRHLASVQWQETERLRRMLTTGWQEGNPLRESVGLRTRAGLPLRESVGLRWQDAVRPPAGMSVVVVPVDPETPPCYDPATLGRLILTEDWANDGRLVLSCVDADTPGATITVPVRRVYIVINTSSLRRVSDNAEIPCFDLALSLDTESWTWGFTASAPLAAQDLLVASTPVELRASINGTEIRLVVEDVQRERVFGQTSLRVAGRGRNAFLDAPYAAQMHFSNPTQRTALQLMQDVLSVNGTPLGWSVDWQMDDWIVPAGAFSHQGTRRSALGAIAAAAGGFIRPHASSMSLSVIHRYPLAPWDWASATPDLELPAAVTAREGLRWVEKPTYNHVFVRGEGLGVTGDVTRTGTAGDLEAPMVVDPLITATEAARQRGLAVLADTGRQKHLSLRLPVLPETGIVLPGTLLRYVDEGATHLGLVRGVSVESRFPNVHQTLEVESHE